MKVRMGKKGWFLTLFVALGILGLAAWRWRTPPTAGGDGQADASARKSSSEQPADSGKNEAQWLEHLRKLPAGERKLLLDSVATKESYHAAANVPTAIEKLEGVLRSSVMSEIVCLVRAESRNVPAARILWIIADRTKVKMGDKLIEFDDEPIKQRLKEQGVLIAEAENTLRLASEHVGRVLVEQRVKIQFAEIDLKLASLSLKRYDGNDPRQISSLQAASNSATRALEQSRADVAIHEGKAIRQQQEKKALLDLALAALRDLEEDLTTCRLYAPRDGQVVHAEPQRAKGRFMAGQRILWVCDLDDMRMIARTDARSKPDIALVRPGQFAYIRAGVPSFPSPAEVLSVVRQENGIFVTEFKFTRDERADKQKLNELASLLPDMPATATITLEEKRISVPLSAVLGQGMKKFCYVLEGKEVHERGVVIGKEGQRQVEVMEGLKEGDNVLVDPRGLVRELAEWSRTKK